MTYTARIKGRKYEAATMEELSDKFVDIRDGMGLGASQLPSAPIFQNGKQVAHISYNGKVWAGLSGAWAVGDKPLFDPYLRPAESVDVRDYISRGLGEV